jgi:hypothetical protein
MAPQAVQASLEPEPDPLGHTATIRRDEVTAQPPVQDLFNEDTPAVPQSMPELEPELEPVPDTEPPVAPAPQTNVGVSDDLQLLSLAGGSFAAALTPPPMPNKAPTASSLQSMSTQSGQAPWDTVAPPALGKDAKDEGWSIGGSGPPPLAGQKGPPPVPKKNELDAFAEALGLPSIPQNDRPEKAPPPAIVVSTPSDETLEEDDAAALKSHRKKLFVFGGLGAVVLVVLAIVLATAASKDPVPPIVETAPAVSGTTSAPVAVSGTSAASGATAVSGTASAPSGAGEDKTAVDPAKRALALDHYVKGNKLYLQRKYGDALAEYKKALDSDQSFALAYRGLGVTYASQNKREKAIESYKAYLRMAPDAKDASSVKMIIQKAEAEK